ncbi:hypothetical protein B0H66DRAFT_558470 [Apodospora peruviana]|uniref:Uncharacterized protein n=1 Tax=Apodospora peruviana TaxID=516989 RepID=A0AAE0I5J1_9PEZI|nr:hypothetical protein B0H66DRAFT_558470 [Apodospora peruviana]
MSSLEYYGQQHIPFSYVPVTRIPQATKQYDAPPHPCRHKASQRYYGQDDATRTYPVSMSRARGRSSVPRTPLPNYRPSPLRWRFLTGLVFIILGLIIMVEVACRLLPAESDRYMIPSSEPNQKARFEEDESSSSRRVLPRLAASFAKNESTINHTPSASGEEHKTWDEHPATSSPRPPSSLPDLSIPSVTSMPPTSSGAPVLDLPPASTTEDIPPWKLTSVWWSEPTDAPWTDPITQSLRLGSPDDYGNDGEWTETETFSSGIKNNAPIPTGKGNEKHWATSKPWGEGGGGGGGRGEPVDDQTQGPATATTLPGAPAVMLPPVETTIQRKTTLPPVVVTESGVTTVSQVVEPITRLTTVDNVVSTFTRTNIVDGVPTAVVEVTTLNGVVRSFIEETTLKAVVSHFTKVQTIDGAVSEYSEVATLNGVLYVAPQVSTLLDSNGVPTATVTSTPSAISTPTVITMTDSNGIPTATIATNVLAPPLVTVLTDSAGVPTTTITQFPTRPSSEPTTPPPQTIVKVYSLSKSEWFVGFFLSPLLSSLLTIPIRMIDLSAKQLQPWHELTRAQGASASDSLCLKTDGVYGILTSFRALRRGQALVFLTTLLSICSLVLVPLSAEAVALKLHMSCAGNDFKGCGMTLGVFLGPARAMIAILALMAVMLVLIMVVLRRWQSGVSANPWTLAGVASLSTNQDVRALFSSLPTGHKGEPVRRDQIIRALDGRAFKLGYFINHNSVPEYGITIVQQQFRPSSMKSNTSLSTFSDSDGVPTPPRQTRGKAKHHLPFLMLSFTGRISFLLILTGVMVVVLYYNHTGGDTAFERFMGTQNFGARALFTLVGVVITFFWSSFFTGLAMLSPFCLLARGPQPASRSILLAPPLSAFTGIWSAFKQRHLFLVVVAFTAILSEFMPILLNNIPFRVTQTWVTHLVCTWLAVGILGVMWLVVVGSFLVKWPHMPADPSTIAGAMFYVSDSRMLWSLEGLSVLDREDRDRRVGDLGLKFEFGTVMGLSGRKRTGVDAVHDQT